MGWCGEQAGEPDESELGVYVECGVGCIVCVLVCVCVCVCVRVRACVRAREEKGWGGRARGSIPDKRLA